MPLKKFDKDHGFFLSSGITFNLLICLIPLILLFLALLGTYLYSYREVLSHIRRYLENAFPSLDPRIMNNLLRIIRDRRIVGVVGIGGLVWTSTWVFSSLRTVLNIVFQAKEGRGILRGKGIDLLMVLLAGTFLLISMVFTSVMTFVQGYRFSPFLNMVPVIRFILKYLIPFFSPSGCSSSFTRSLPIEKSTSSRPFRRPCFTSLLWEAGEIIFGACPEYGKILCGLWFFEHSDHFRLMGVLFCSHPLLGGEVAFLLEKEREKSMGESRNERQKSFARSVLPANPLKCWKP